MGTTDSTARPHAPSGGAAKTRPAGGPSRTSPTARKPRTARRAGRGGGGGVIHDNIRHTTRFTVIGNDLAQHPDLSLVAIGLATHIQSLPSGAKVDIVTLAERFPEGRKCISRALNELEAHGYLRRTTSRNPSGHIITITVSCNHPEPSRAAVPAAPPPLPTPLPEATPDADSTAPATLEGPSLPAPSSPPGRTVGKTGGRTGGKTAPRRPALPAVPQPLYPAPGLLEVAFTVVAGLRRHDNRLLVSTAEAEHLVPGVAAWLERDCTPEDVLHALTRRLPDTPLHRPAALLAHRLTDGLPPLPALGGPPAARHPLQNCDTCDRAYRAPEPGTCPACTP
ncbi:helix-turn-helix domain-containing protein [Streptomyces filamentosus]|uniref:helix-turn-helix domain-containing protein n=1 Tax=Streptomyces filamentosus TaxID=67294 RepID=UPI00381EDED1